MRGEKCGDGLRQTQCAKDKSNSNKERSVEDERDYHDDGGERQKSKD